MAPSHPNKQPPISIVEPPTSSTSTAESSASSSSTTEYSPSSTGTSAISTSTPNTSEIPASTPGYSYPTTTTTTTTPSEPTTPSSATTAVSLQSGTTQTPADPTASPAAGAVASSSAAAAAASASSYPGTTTSVTTGSTSNLNAGAIAGGTIGGVVVLALLILGLILCRRAQRRKHIAPSSEFAETIKRGELPVLRLDCGVEIVPSVVQHHIPLPLKQDSYYTSPAMSDMKFPDGMGGSDEQSVRYSIEKPLQPLRRPVQQDSNESMKMGQAPARRVSSIGSSQEFWSRDTGKFDIRKDYRSISPLPATDISYAPLMQNTYPMEPSGAVETLQNAYADLWNLSVAPIAQSRPDSVWNGAGTQPLPPLIPVRRSVDVSQRRF